MSTTRTIGSYLNQQTIQIVKELQVRKFRAHIRAVLFGGHSFAVVAPGYTGPSEVKADPSIDFGTQRRPLVFRGNDCWIEMDDTGHWHATQYVPTNKCTTAPTDVPPNLPLPVYTPPIDTSTISFGGQNFVDLSFTPTNFQIGNFKLNKMPVTSLSSVYDIGDGFNGTIAASTTQQLLYFTTVHAFRINQVSAFCAGTDVKINVFATNGTFADIVLAHNLDTTWTVTIQNPSTGAAISSFTSVAGNGVVRALTGTSIVSIPTVGTVFHTSVVTGANSISSVAYGLGGVIG